ncbi:hypothetical protein BC835DRAFT_1302980 [Cytidiella melzeri]|nr:hypothetical protein BC835DRAFT_1302980 [Cytidiella melzeri]
MQNLFLVLFAICASQVIALPTPGGQALSERAIIGGSATSGNTGPVNGGNVDNHAGLFGHIDNEDGSSVGGKGGVSTSGNAESGGFIVGGDSHTGSTGPASGGSVSQSGDVTNKYGSSRGGDGGSSTSGGADA